MRMQIDRHHPIHIKREWAGPLIRFPRHYVPRRDEIWQAGKDAVRRARG